MRAMGFADDEALLNYDLRSFQGYRLLHEYFALPQRFLFVELSRLGRASSAARRNELELIVLLDRRDADRRGDGFARAPGLVLHAGHEPVPQEGSTASTCRERENEYHVVADRTRPLDFEVHSVTRVAGVGATPRRRRGRSCPFTRAANATTRRARRTSRCTASRA